jgi:UDP-N-acetylmuramoyl-tripeptide--D-alanyl-D-alanine ligase
MSTLRQLQEAVGGHVWPVDDALRDGSQAPLGPVEIDSRQVEPGDVFWALKGKNHDGADFVEEAFERGAAGAVVARPVEVPAGRWAITVDDAQQALWQWAAWTRRRFTGTLIAVTGSVGKTTTREMIHAVLRKRLVGVASPRNYNNHVGVPLSLLTIDAQHDYAVLELGGSAPGEIAALAELCAPKVGVITHVAEAHLGTFGSRQAIAESKAELLAALPSDGQAILGEDPWLLRVAGKCKAEITWVGRGMDCSLKATDIHSGRGTLSFRVADWPFHVPVWGRHHLTAALAAVAVGRLFGLDLPEMAAALEHFDPVPMRCQVIEVRGATIINDAYNASPTAMRAALELLREFDAPGRRIVVCGDMADLGEEAALLHGHLGDQVVSVCGADLLIACGQHARDVVAGARAAGMPRVRSIPCHRPEDALPYLGQAILPGDVVLVKGSRVMGMERIIEALAEFPRRRIAQ